MRGIIRRCLRLELVAGLGIALALPAAAIAAENTRALTTETTLTVEAQEQDGHTQANVTVRRRGWACRQQAL